MKVVILQPSFIPWRGYFHQIQKADLFVFYDCVQYDDRGWRNRNKIKTAAGESWLTIPVKSKGCQTLKTPIIDILIDWEKPWPDKHMKALQHSYSRAPFFSRYKLLLEKIYNRQDLKLADFTCSTTELIALELGIKQTAFVRSSKLPAEGAKTDRLISILKHLGAKHYISGPSAKKYLEKEKFEREGISVEFMSYIYPDYPQINGTFNPNASILDLLFNAGPKAGEFIWGK